MGSFADDVDQFGEVAHLVEGASRMAIERPAPLSEGLPISSTPVAHLISGIAALSLRSISTSAPSSSVGLQEIDCHACSHFCRRA